MAVIEIKHDRKEIERALRKHGPIAEKAAVSAINQVTMLARTRIVRKLSANKKLPQKLIRERVRLSRATVRKQTAWLYTLTRGVPIDRLKYRRSKKGKGITAAGRKFPHAWVWEKSPHDLVMRRRGKSRLPIERVKIELNPEFDRLAKVSIRALVRTRTGSIFRRELKRRLEQTR